jgi:hypothetical protein
MPDAPALGDKHVSFGGLRAKTIPSHAAVSRLHLLPMRT